MLGAKFKISSAGIRIISISLIIALSSIIGVGYAGEPASVDDPLVSLSYVVQKNTELIKQIDVVKALVDEQKVALNAIKVQNDALKATINDLTKNIDTTKGSIGFEVLELKFGQKLIAKDSTEIILRSGKAKAIASAAGGLADLTSDTGVDIKNAQTIPANHLLLVARDDGRGIKITTASAWVMVKGKFEIIEP